jgi:CheY-like chemotaxis protein
VKHLVELHGGNVRAESEGLGRGATFVVTLPVDAGPDGRMPSPPTPERGTTRATPLASLKILVVDDEHDAREVLRLLLTMRGARVVSCHDVDSAIATLDTERFDLILSDISMPGKDGYELIGEVRGRAAERGGRTPAIAVTAFARSEDRARALRAGFQGHVAKPVDIEELALLIRPLVERSTIGP